MPHDELSHADPSPLMRYHDIDWVTIEVRTGSHAWYDSPIQSNAGVRVERRVAMAT
jgi:hypothetical protein